MSGNCAHADCNLIDEQHFGNLTVKIEQDNYEELAAASNSQRFMFLPTLRAVANSLDRKIFKLTVTELIAGTRETFLKKTTDYAVDSASVLYVLFVQQNS